MTEENKVNREEASVNITELINSLQSIRTLIDSPDPSDVDVLDALLASQSLAKLVPEVRSATYAIAGERIQKSEKVGDYTVSKVTYKPTPTLTEEQLGKLREQAPQIFGEITQLGLKMSDAEKEQYQQENQALMEKARAINEALHADEMYYHPALKEKYSTGTGAEALAKLLRQAGPEWEEVIQSWTVRPFIFRLVKKN